MELPLIYKYQPKLLNDFQMNEETLHLLKTMINMNTLNILFIGDSGVGKTSLINAIIYDYYNGQFKEENILSINSLKEQGISYYRNEVKTFCQSSSLIVGKKKILLLDDLDIINEQSQQVFRNCIDKYSHNVHFIASCSNPQKVIDGLQSRMMIIKLHPLNLEHLGKIVNKICSYENIHLTNEAEKFLLSISNNSIRIVINYLEKCKLLNCEINVELLDAVCTNIAFQDFTNYTNLCKNEKNIQQAVVLIYKLFDRGYSVMDILDNYFLFVKTTNMLTDDEKYKIIPYICKYITIFHNVHEDEIELAFFTNNLINIFS
jgi:DNA polymerase III delta prime subunit